MIVRPPKREHDPSWQAETDLQPDPMLRADQRASPMVMAAAAALGLVIVITVFYGLTRGPAPMATSTASSSSSASMSTSGQAPATDANAPSPADQSNTAAHGTGSARSGEAQPANQGQSDLPGRSGENP